VVDASHPDPGSQIETVRNVVGEVGASNVLELVVFNKIDLVDETTRMALRGLVPGAMEVSARSGEGIAELLTKIEELLPEPNVRVNVVVPYSRGDLVSRIHLNSKIEQLEYVEDGTKIIAMVRPELAAELAQFSR
jgi:GTP-binding protein HflX